MSPAGREAYEASVRQSVSIDSAFRSAEARGQREKALEIARNLIALGLDDATVAKSTGLSEHEVAELRGTAQ